MKTNMIPMKLLAIPALCAALLTPASAALTISFHQDGQDVMVTAYGTVDIAGASWLGEVAESAHGARSDDGTDDTDVLWNILKGDDHYKIGDGGEIFTEPFTAIWATEFSGDSFGIYASDDSSQFSLYVPDGFTSGTISGTMRFADALVQDFGVKEQKISWGTSPDQRVILLVPEPSGALPLGLSIALGFLIRRR